MKPHRGTLILVLGILGLLLCQPLGIVAWILGNGDLKEMAAGAMDPAGKDLTNIGRILGIVAAILMVLGIIFAIGMVVLGMGAAGAAATSGY
jgi:hypothetical protein